MDDLAQDIRLTESEREQIRVERWRMEELERAGYERHQAARLASREYVDLHQAVDLIQGGCPRDTAVRILL